MADITYEEMGQFGQSEVAERTKTKQTQAREYEAIPNEFAKMQAAERSQAKLQEIRDSSRSMAEMAKQRELNFDEGLRNQRRLAKLDTQVSKQLLDEELKFKEDSAGRKLLSERQLLDWYTTRARSEEDWSSFEARSNQIHARKLQYLEVAYRKLEAEELKLYKTFKSNLDIETKKFIAERKIQIAKQIEKAKRKAANKSALIGGLSQAVGAGVTIGVTAMTGGNVIAGTAAGATASMGTAAVAERSL